MLLLIAFGIATSATSAEIVKNKELPPSAKESRQTPAAESVADPVADLFPVAGSQPQQVAQPVPQPIQPVPQSAQPTYESWDVLRQYPRFTQLPPPSVSESKEQEHQKEIKEKTDVEKKAVEK
jgi:hypothetical protein